MNITDFVFIVFGEEYHYNPLGVVRSLGESGIKPIVILYGGREHVVSSSKYVGKAHHVNTVDEGYEILIKEYRNVHQKAFIIACDDIVNNCLDNHYDELREYFFFNNAGQRGRLAKYQDKSISGALAQKCGMKVPKSWDVKKGEVPDDIEYPVLTKPLTSYAGWKKDYHICYNEDELRAAYRTIQCDVLLLQKYIKKKNEYSVDGIVWNQGKSVFISVETVYTYLLPDYYSLEMVHKTFRDQSIQTFLERMFSEIGFEGIFSIDALIDENDEKYFLEINYRNSAWSYASTKLGMNLPLLWAKGMAFGDIGTNVRKEVPEHYIALSELMDFNMRVRKYHYISPFKWFIGVLRANCLYLWNWKDIKPAIIAWISKFSRGIKKTGGKK